MEFRTDLTFPTRPFPTCRTMKWNGPDRGDIDGTDAPLVRITADAPPIADRPLPCGRAMGGD